MSKELIQFQDIIQLEILCRPSKRIKSPYVADAINKDGDEFLVHTPGLGLADQCMPGSKIFATPSKNKSSKTDYIAQSVSVNERYYGKTLIGANPHTAELILDIKSNEIIKKPFIVINDNTFYEYSAYEHEEDLIQNLFKKSGRKSEKYIYEGKQEDIQYRNNLKRFVEEIYSNNHLKDLDIVIRPHPAVNIDKFKSFFFPILPNSNRIKIERTGDALSIMAEAEGVFHQNCTTGLEGYYAGLNNIFNFAEMPRNGFSENNLNISPCLGIEGSIKAFELFLKGKDNFKKKISSNLFEKKKNLYDIIGEEIKNKNSLYKNEKIKKNRNNDLKETFHSKKVFDKFNNGRWNFAEEILYSLKKKNSKYKKVLGSVGIVIGNWQ